ncbi:hypothetical protein JY97_02805 [Alkalispirochaeta odontotermitis]|nr:hypothetical protein JY97_02805 [Alkalispirochaeta odontotermitis]CAB1083180.1 hypothetical protein D1AOALGA4SA_10759 [Olavius algarvensis Delta 1 endosymbiont]
MHWALIGRDKGFSLVELAIVVLVLGITAMTVVPQWQAMAREAKLNGATGEVILALEYARNLAVKHQRPFQLKAYTTAHGDRRANQFLVKDDRYASDWSAHGEAEPPVYTWGRVYHPLDKRPYVIDFDGSQEALVGVIAPGTEYDGVIITGVPGGGTSGILHFYPNGHCSDPAGPDNTIVLNYAGVERTITVDAITGRITVQ